VCVCVKSSSTRQAVESLKVSSTTDRKRVGGHRYLGPLVIKIVELPVRACKRIE
jgi:hypothetical protein